MKTKIALPITKLARYSVVFIPALFIFDQAGLAKQFHVDGSLTYTTFQDGKESTLVHAKFSISVDSCFWKIRINKSDEGRLLFEEMWNEADGVYTRKVFDADWLRSAASKRPTIDGRERVAITNIVTVRNGSIPQPDTHYSIAPWLAYASSCYFETNQNRCRKLLTMNNALFDNEKVTVPIRIHFANASSEFPDDIAFLNEGFYYVPGPGGSLEKKPLRPPFDKGFIETRYHVREFVTVSDLVLPGKFSISYFMPKPDAKSNEDPLMIARLDAEIKSANAESKDTLVYDYRGGDGSTNSVKQYYTSGFSLRSSHF